jgi:hypothetical protein
MAEQSLAAVFGANATQDVTDLTIKKADLTGVGLTPGANNTAESLLLAINLKAKESLTETARETNIDQSVALTDEFRTTTTTRNSNIYLRNTISIEVDKLLPGANIIDPDDY